MTTATIDASGDIRNIIMMQGTSFDLSFTITTASNDPFDLTGFDARFQVRKSYGAKTEVNGTLANGTIVIANPTTGVMQLVLQATDTSSITFASTDDESIDMVYDLELISPTNLTFRPTRGTFTMIREVTK